MKPTLEQRLAEQGLTLPNIDLQTKMIDRAKRFGNVVYVSGHVPTDADGKLALAGQVGKDVTVEAAREAARLCVVNCLASVEKLLGSLDAIQEVLRVRVFVSCTPDFDRQADVANGATELLLALFGPAGRHTRTAIGCPSLPVNAAVEVDMSLALSSASQ